MRSSEKENDTMKISSALTFSTIVLLSICLYPTTFAACSACSGNTQKCVVCSNTPINLTATGTIAKFRELAGQIWYQDGLNLTPLAKQFRNILLNLNANGSSADYLHTTISSIMFNNFAPFMDYKPDACVMAAIVNATVSCHVDHKQTLLQSALSQLLARFPHINKDNKMRMVMSAGCHYECGNILPDAANNKTICFKNGFVYPIKTYWNLPRPPFYNASSTLKEIVFKLYRSNNFVDNYIAACTSFSLADVVHRLWARRNTNLIIEATVLGFSDEIDKKCCYSRITRADNIRDLNDRGANMSITLEKASINITKCL